MTVRPRLTHTRTFATLEVSGAAYDEIAAKLLEADYGHAFIDDAIDMHGIALVREPITTVDPQADGATGMVIDPDGGAEGLPESEQARQRS